MRKIVIFTMILTVIFAMVGCTAHSEPDKKATESSSANAVIDTRQAEEFKIIIASFLLFKIRLNSSSIFSFSFSITTPHSFFV